MLNFFRKSSSFLTHPVAVLRQYSPASLRGDLVAGVTVGIVLLPQALAFSLLAGLPPVMGLYAAIVAAIVGALWGSSNHLHTGPTNTASILTLSVLLPIAAPGTPAFVTAAGLIAVMAGLFRLAMGFARLGLLVNFVSDSVAVGFTAGAGMLILSNQLEPMLRVDTRGASGLIGSLRAIAAQLGATHLPSLALGVATIATILVFQQVNKRLPALLIAVVAVSLGGWLLGLENQGVRVLGQLPANLPPLAALPIFDLDLVGKLANGALALALIGLVEATSIARAVSNHSRQRLNTNQEFIGQGLANIASGLFSGYPVSGSFNRSALSYQAGAASGLGNLFSGVFVLIGMFVLAPLTAHVPRAVLAGALALTAYTMIDVRSIRRIWRGSLADAIIMLATLVATLLLPLQFAVLLGVLMSLGAYLFRTSNPNVQTVLPDPSYNHWVHQPGKPNCPQLGVIQILGDMYFGAVNHIEEKVYEHLQAHPEQRFLMLRLQSVQRCDISGIRALESIMRMCRDRGGDLYLVNTRPSVLQVMGAAGFTEQLGADHVLQPDMAIDFLFHRVIDPAVCIYECPIRAFKECQNLPKRDTAGEAALALSKPMSPVAVPAVAPRALWEQLHEPQQPTVIDVREPREFRQGHIPQARLMPLPELPTQIGDLPHETAIVLVCRSGRRSQRAAALLAGEGYNQITILQGGMLAWEAERLLEAVE